MGAVTGGGGGGGVGGGRGDDINKCVASDVAAVGEGIKHPTFNVFQFFSPVTF